MRRDTKIAVFVGLGVLGGLLLALQEPPDPGRVDQDPKPEPKPKPDPPKPTVPLALSPDAQDDETALARMLQSETSDKSARVVIGWYAIQTALRTKKNLFDRLTAGAGYGPRKKDGVSRYASTAKPPTAAARELARQLLAKEIQPSSTIRAFGQSSWVEELPNDQKQYTEATAAAVLRHQGKPIDFGGIWGRIKGTRWYLISSKAPIVAAKPTARAALTAVPDIEPLDVA